MLKMKVAPKSSFTRAQSLPPWDSTIDRLMLSPMPIPEGFVV